MLILSPVSVLELSLLEDICIVVGSCPAMIVESSSGDGGVHQVIRNLGCVRDGTTGCEWSFYGGSGSQLA